MRHRVRWLIPFSGTVPEGAVSGPIDPIRVDCNPNAKPARVHAIGVIKVGSTPVLLVFQATATGFTAFVVPTATTKQHFYMTTDPTAATISPTGPTSQAWRPRAARPIPSRSAATWSAGS